mmetsp:Transcript_71528/g.191000  ORF Transcript_71528/g.191000 Transcript_71528/m.191000 type:complete len:223 (-) Transcript_71528:34-702(-)
MSITAEGLSSGWQSRRMRRSGVTYTSTPTVMCAASNPISGVCSAKGRRAVRAALPRAAASSLSSDDLPAPCAPSTATTVKSVLSVRTRLRSSAAANSSRSVSSLKTLDVGLLAWDAGTPSPPAACTGSEVLSVLAPRMSLGAAAAAGTGEFCSCGSDSPSSLFPRAIRKGLASAYPPRFSTLPPRDPPLPMGLPLPTGSGGGFPLPSPPPRALPRPRMANSY